MNSFVVFNILTVSLNRFFTLIAFDKKENAIRLKNVQSECKNENADGVRFYGRAKINYNLFAIAHF